MADLAEVSHAQVQPVGAGGMELGSPASGKAIGDTLGSQASSPPVLGPLG